MSKLLFRTLGVPAYRPHVAVTCFQHQQISLRHTHDFHEVFLVISGEGLHHINRSQVELKPGHLVVIQPEDCHHFSCPGEQSFAILNVAISRGGWKSFHQLMGSSIPAAWHRHGEPRGHVLLSPGKLREMQRAFEQLAGSATRAPSDVVETLLRVIAQFETSPQVIDAVLPSWLESWRAEMQEAGEALAEPIAYWQKRSGCSPEHLARSCRRYFKCTPTDLLNRLRIERAKLLLRSTNEKVISICYACGFGNLANFYRNFSAQTGMTPKTWRKRVSATVPLQR